MDIAQFEFEEVIGHGAFGDVIKVKEKSTLNRFAAKCILKSHLKQETNKHFVRNEKNILLQINQESKKNNGTYNRNIVKLHHTCEDDQFFYYILSIAENGELLNQIQKFGGLNIDCVRFWSAEIITALQYLHNLGIIHRDLKPENILLDASWHIVITDFGSAKLLPPTEGIQPRKGSFIGTPAYMPPELVCSSKTCFSSDLWALGCVIYQMCCGQLLFKESTDYLTFKKIRESVAHDGHGIVFPPHFPQDAKDLVRSLLKQNPLDRIGAQSIDALKTHRFFEGIDWANLHNTQPPPVCGPSQWSINPNGKQDASQEDLQSLSGSRIQQQLNSNSSSCSRSSPTNTLLSEYTSNINPYLTKVWVPSSELGWYIGIVLESDGDYVYVKNLENHSVEIVRRELVILLSLGGLEIDDFTDEYPGDTELFDFINYHPDHIHEATILHNLRKRFEMNNYYTFISPTLLVGVIPSQPPPTPPPAVDSSSSSEVSSDLLDVFTSRTYTVFRENGQSQAIVLVGESGSGKSETKRHILNNLIKLEDVKTNYDLVSSYILSIETILSAVGNISTPECEHSSRIVNFTKLFFSKRGHLIGIKLIIQFFEHFRVVRKNPLQSNFHIFYQLLNGSNEEEKQTYQISGCTSENFEYLKSRFEPATNNNNTNNNNSKQFFCDAFLCFKKALSVLKINEKEILTLFSGILLIGNIQFKKDQHQVEVTDVQLLSDVANRLGLPIADLCGLLTNQTSVDDAFTIRDKLAMALYGLLFDWLLCQMNCSLSELFARVAEDHLDESVLVNEKTKFIGILDQTGFENLSPDDNDNNSSNGFEQFCVNYWHEKLLNLFFENLNKEQKGYRKIPNLCWSKIKFSTNQEQLQFLERDRSGVVSILNDIPFTPNSSMSSSRGGRSNSISNDMKFLKQIATRHKGNQIFHHHSSISSTSASSSSQNHQRFIILHMNDSVSYEVGDWLQKNASIFSQAQDKQMLMSFLEQHFTKLSFHDTGGGCGAEGDGHDPLSVVVSSSPRTNSASGASVTTNSFSTNNNATATPNGSTSASIHGSSFTSSAPGHNNPTIQHLQRRMTLRCLSDSSIVSSFHHKQPPNSPTIPHHQHHHDPHHLYREENFFSGLSVTNQIDAAFDLVKFHLSGTICNFIIFIKPNNNSGLATTTMTTTTTTTTATTTTKITTTTSTSTANRKPFDRKKVLNQIRSYSLTETIRLRKAGYENCLRYEKFYSRYSALGQENLVKFFVDNYSLMAVSRKKIYFKDTLRLKLEKQLCEVLCLALILQRYIRRYNVLQY